MNVTLLDHLPPECNAVADVSDEATFYHTDVWLESLAATYAGLSLRCLVAEDGGAVRGYFPYFVVRAGPLRRVWSLPLGTYGGPVAGGDDALHGLLLDAYRRVGNQRGVVEVGLVDFHNRYAVGGSRADPGETHVIDLSGGFERVWRERVARDKRKRARRAERLGVCVERCIDPAGIDEHYRVYSDRMAAFGRAAPLPRELFQRLFERGGDRVRLYLARDDDGVLGSHFNFYYKRMVIAWYGMSSEVGDRAQAGTLLYATCIRDACEEGFATYNLGASLQRESLIAYKEGLGGTPYRYTTWVRRSPLGRLGAALAKLKGRR